MPKAKSKKQKTKKQKITEANTNNVWETDCVLPIIQIAFEDEEIAFF